MALSAGKRAIYRTVQRDERNAAAGMIFVATGVILVATSAALACTSATPVATKMTFFAACTGESVVLGYQT
jgi:hypothetical protein